MKISEIVQASTTERDAGLADLERAYGEANAELSSMALNLAKLITKLNRVPEAKRATASLKSALKGIQQATVMLGG